MSTPARSGAGTWIFSIVGALVLYVATWPLVEIKSMVTGPTTTMSVSETSFQSVTVSYYPTWTQVVYLPLNSLRDSTGGDNLFSRYWNWWFSILA